MRDRVAQRDQTAEADPAEEDRAIAELIDQEMKRCDLIVLTDEKAGLVGVTLTEKIEGCDAKLSGDQRVAVGRPQGCVLPSAR